MYLMRGVSSDLWIVSTLFPYQITKVMQVPLAYAEDIIGVGGGNIAYIRRTSRATLTVQESRVPEEITIEIKGTSSEVQTAEQLIQVWSSSLVVRPSPCTSLFSFIYSVATSNL